jgi:hypothetical protein
LDGLQDAGREGGGTEGGGEGGLHWKIWLILDISFWTDLFSNDCWTDCRKLGETEVDLRAEAREASIGRSDYSLIFLIVRMSSNGCWTDCRKLGESEVGLRAQVREASIGRSD